MRYFFVVIIAFLGIGSSVFAQAKLLNDKMISFDVFLDAKPVGTHVFTFAQTKNTLKVNSKMQIRAKLWGLFTVNYNHESTEYWRNGCLTGLDAVTKERGKTIRVSAQLKDKGLEIVSADGIDILQGCIKSFAYWNPSLLSGERLLNTENGELVSVKITTTNSPNGSKSVLIDNPVADISLDYSSTNQWLSLKSQLKVGGELHYIRQ